jgi:intein/homing endonuclease
MSDGYKNIECVEIGDMVYTHKGNFKKVINKHKHSERNKLKVDIKYFGYNLPLSVTEDHQIYVFNINKNIYEWVEAINIKPNKHMMAFNYSDLPLEMLNEIELINNDPDTFINCYGVEQRKGTKQKIKNKIHLTNELLYAFGWYIAEGWCNIDGTKKSCNISICGNLKTEKKRCENIINIISNAFELKTINSYENKRNTIQYSVYSKQLAIHFRNWFGHKVHQKQFPEWVYNLNEEQCKNLLNGYYDGDGYKRKNTQQATTVSNKLAGQLCVLNAKLKNPITVRLNKSTGHPMWSYEHTLITKTTNTRIKNVNNCVHFPIKEVTISKIKHTTNENTVYDLTVEEDHSFVVGLSTVHNCHRIGQTKKVNVYYNIIDETLDLYLFEALMKKMKVIDTVMGDSNVDDDIFRDVIEGNTL